ncbi:MAG: hypothetical protein HY369_01175 [Candidatus Aenigmarchaeota archaeon]|nr:hypothetical protein [Candidatus Aenigmarchaeota archaeon]
MALELAIGIAQWLLQLHPLFLVVIFLILVYLAFRVAFTIVRMLGTGLAFATFPFIANFLGIPVPITLETLFWSVVAGVLTYLAYMSISFGTRIINLVFYPFRKAFSGPQQKVVKVKEKKKKGE